MKFLTVLGARPQFIKAAPVSRSFDRFTENSEVVVHTGQHHDANMSDVFFDELQIARPKWQLGIAGGTHGAMTGQMLQAVEAVILEEKPDWVLVYGDTNSTLAGALAASKIHIPVAHIEAGLRSFNRLMPEEINRVLVDHLSTKLFAPTRTAVENLAREGIEGGKTHLVGDVMFDAVKLFGPMSQARTTILDDLRLGVGDYVLATVHRAENTDDPRRLSTIVNELIKLAKSLPVVFPLHPRTRKTLEQSQLLTKVQSSILVTEPLGYLEMMALERNAAVIATDSGGVQKEAYFHKVPCVTLRDETEWVELIAARWNCLCPPHPGSPIADTVLAAVGRQGNPEELYGDGAAADEIVGILTESIQNVAGKE